MFKQSISRWILLSVTLSLITNHYIILFNEVNGSHIGISLVDVLDLIASLAVSGYYMLENS